MKVSIFLPYENVEQTPLFAVAERSVDWHSDPASAERCTIAFAAVELASHLKITGVSDVSFSTDRSSQDFDVTESDARNSSEVDMYLRMRTDDRPSGSFTITPVTSGLVITGSDRVGVLYGAYEFLRLQGWSWLEPGPEGEYAPSTVSSLVLPETEFSEAPAFPLWRGFDFSFMSKESEEFLLWMARNRLNLAGYRAASGEFGRKLGMRYKNGGHIFEKILDPANTTESGKAFWDAHYDWYGTPGNGEKVIEGALRTQFCVSQPELLDYLGDELVKRIVSEWYEADLVAVWGFDTWGSCCTCDSCKALGNDSDQYLHLLSHLRGVIDRAVRNGRIRKSVRMAGCGYEGTSTLVGPENEIPANLRVAGDAIIYYPIDRSYAATLLDEGEVRNQPYASALRSWVERDDALPVIVGEYYNVSKFEDLPALFSECIRGDLSDYHQLGIQGMTYMHVPMINWAVRAQTQVLYAYSCWDGEEFDPQIDKAYFETRYGPFSDRIKQAYRDIETGFARISEWRAWHQSILDFLQKWDGRRPDRPMRLPSCFANPDEAIASGRHTVRFLRRAFDEIVACQEEERDGHFRDGGDVERAENPIEAIKQRTTLEYERVLGEDKRLLRYGIDTMEAMTEVIAYYEGFHLSDERSADNAWNALLGCVDRLDSYWVPISYEHPGPGLKSLDGYARSQLGGVVNRCRAARGR